MHVDRAVRRERLGCVPKAAGHAGLHQPAHDVGVARQSRDVRDDERRAHDAALGQRLVEFGPVIAFAGAGLDLHGLANELPGAAVQERGDGLALCL